jgi:hypothetical protein
MKTIAIRTFFAALLLCSALPVFSALPALAADHAATAPMTPQPALAAEPEHVVTDAEIQAGIDGQLHSEAADRQAILDLLARPEVQRIAGQAGLSLTKANDAIPTLSGPELQRLASQAREVNSQAIGGDRITMNTTTIIIILLIVVLIIVLA